MIQRLAKDNWQTANEILSRETKPDQYTEYTIQMNDNLQPTDDEDTFIINTTLDVFIQTLEDNTYIQKLIICN